MCVCHLSLASKLVVAVEEKVFFSLIDRVHGAITPVSYTHLTLPTTPYV